MQPPRHLSTRILELVNLSEHNANNIACELNAIKGVVETMIVTSDQVAYVKYAPEELDIDQLDAFRVSSS